MVHLRSNKMNFSAAEVKELDRRCRSISVAARLIEQSADEMPFSAEEYPHVWDRLTQIRSMSHEQLLREVEADYLLFEFTRFKGEKGFEFVQFGNGE